MSDKSLKKFQKFVIVGMSNTILSYCVFIFFMNTPFAFTLKSVVSQAISYAAGIVWSFFLNSKWTFRRTGKCGGSFLPFVISQIIMMALSAGLIGVTVDILHVPATPAWVGTMTIITFLNFYLLKNYVFTMNKAY